MLFNLLSYIIYFPKIKSCTFILRKLNLPKYNYTFDLAPLRKFFGSAAIYEPTNLYLNLNFTY